MEDSFSTINIVVNPKIKNPANIRGTKVAK